jgi:hypothetical protein
MFSCPPQTAFSDHIHHAFHHDFTIKKPRPTPHFFQNPIKKRPQNLKTGSTGASDFFCKLTGF